MIKDIAMLEIIGSNASLRRKSPGDLIGHLECLGASSALITAVRSGVPEELDVSIQRDMRQSVKPPDRSSYCAIMTWTE